MFTVEVRDHIMIAHSFKGEVFGPAQALHGATFVVDAAFMSKALDSNGIVIDIGRALDVLKATLSPLNYSNLDAREEFWGSTPPPNFSPNTFSICWQTLHEAVNWAVTVLNCMRSGSPCPSPMWLALGTKPKFIDHRHAGHVQKTYLCISG